MEGTPVFGLIILIANVIVSYQGFKDHNFLEKYSFKVDEVLIYKEYKRIVTSGFLHVGWLHLLFNMIALYSFSTNLELSLGVVKFLILYFSSLVGGSLLSLFIHRNHSDYSAVGASGAISGIVFASIALFPGIEIGLLGILYIPSWAYGLLYVLVSIYGIKSQRDNIGHDAHLGGGLIGLLVAIVMVPSSLEINYFPISVILIPSMIFIYIIITKPEFLLVENLFQKAKGVQTIEDKYNYLKSKKEKELDRLLDKINRKSINGLTKKEKEKLKELSN
jgi:membrane associated rhomboid family serine protease